MERKTAPTRDRFCPNDAIHALLKIPQATHPAGTKAALERIGIVLIALNRPS
jgi:hypothetical protein